MDLSVGTPVDPVPGVVQDALRAAADAPGYPATHGTRALREAAAGWLGRRHGVTVDPDAVLPLIGTKEFIASLPGLLGCGPGDAVAYPELAYPTYDIGARLAGADPVAWEGFPAAGRAPGPPIAATDRPAPVTPGQVRLAWVNSPSNPTGRVLGPGALRDAAAWARDQGAVLASDECYIGLGWDAEPVSVLHPGRVRRVVRGPARGALGVQAVQPGRLPGRLRHRRPRAGRPAAGDPQARRDDHARPGPGGHDGGARRRRARGTAALGLRGAPGPAPAGPGEGRLDDHPLRGGPVPVGLASGA